MWNAKNSLFALLLVSLCARAEEIPKKYVDVYDPNYPKDAFKNIPDVKVQPHKKKNSQSLPSPAEREAAFEKVKDLPALISDWDDMEKDLLYMRAKHGTAAELKKQYPQMDATLLTKLSKAIKE